MKRSGFQGKAGIFSVPTIFSGKFPWKLLKIQKTVFLLRPFYIIIEADVRPRTSFIGRQMRRVIRAKTKKRPGLPAETPPERAETTGNQQKKRGKTNGK